MEVAIIGIITVVYVIPLLVGLLASPFSSNMNIEIVPPNYIVYLGLIGFIPLVVFGAWDMYRCHLSYKQEAEKIAIKQAIKTK